VYDDIVVLRSEDELTTLGDDFRSPDRFDLEIADPYPNPTEAGTTLGFALNRQAEITITANDVLGRTVRTIVSGPLPAGNHRLYWDAATDHGNRVAPGVYFIRLTHPAGRLTQTVTIVK
jgi:hypothetical protein